MSDSASFASMVPIGWIIGCPLLGFISDRMGHRKPVLIGGAVVMGLAALAALYVEPGFGVLLWTMSKGISRYGEMRRANPNISEKVLAYELRKLQSLGLIVKEVEKRERVTMTEYKLTERGFGVIPLLEHMESWAKADRESEIASQKG